MTTHRIAPIPGGGIGKKVIPARCANAGAKTSTGSSCAHAMNDNDEGDTA